MKPRGPLMIEHRLIEKLLRSACEVVQQFNGDNYDPVVIESIVDFVRTYADRTHHGKEEDILFQQLSQRNLEARDLEAMNELAAEHKQAREKVRQIVVLNERYKEGDNSVVSQIKDVVLWLGGFYPKHIKKEDKEFFPETEKYFNDQELQRMLDEFWAFDRKMIHEKYRRVAEDIHRQAHGTSRR